MDYLGGWIGLSSLWMGSLPSFVYRPAKIIRRGVFMKHKAVFLSAASLLASPAALAADVAAAPASNVIVVTAPTPLSDSGSTPDTQRATAEDIAASGALDLSEYLNRRLGSVYLNATQNNPLQPDINYRGFTASPLLGTPQGLSVYLDGVRQNQAFGDIVSWDLIPREAIASVALVPASDPLFGRNTLGGALSVRTKSGRDAPGVALDVNGGSFGRRRIAGEVGGVHGGLDYYATTNHFEENGWRDYSPSNADQAFARVGWTSGPTTMSLTGSFADTDLNGNGLQEQRLLAADRDSVYTQPDNTRNRAYATTLTARHELSDRVAIVGNAYYRHIRTATFNGDINDDALGESLYQPSAAEQQALAIDGFSGFPTAGETQGNTPFPKWRCIANILLNDEPNEKCNGLANRSSTRSHNYGGSLELHVSAPISGFENRFVLGGNWQADRAHFRQTSQFGYLDANRGGITVDGPGAFADGTQNSENAFDARVDLAGRTYGTSLFATDTLALTPRLNLAVSVRYDRTVIDNRDRLTPGGGPGSLDGNPHYDHVNPAATLSFTADPALKLHASLAQTSRAPTAIELGCADPENPCRLPNALAGDPPLDQVVTRTGEIGGEGELFGGGLHWSLAAFRADNRRDLLFVTDDASGFGYFRNFGRTRRQGVELGLSGRRGRLSFSAHYTYLDATFRSPGTVDGSANSSNDGPAPGFEGDIDIDRGDRLPLVPRHIARLSATFDLGEAFSVNGDLQAQSGMTARGNENGEHRADGMYYLGSGKTAGFAVANLGVEWRPVPWLKLYGQITNVFDKHYATAAQLAATGFAANGSFVARPFSAPVIDGERPLLNSTFYSPGAPRAVWVGARIMFAGAR
jgi:outer membrane receptor protein involved in Fe transport